MPRKKSTPEPVRPVERALVLRTCNADMTSHGGFKWPMSGPVSCSDWSPKAKCGHGLHGLLRGEGDASLLNLASDAKWLAVWVDVATVVDLEGKVKFPAGEVALVGGRDEVVAYLRANGCSGPVVFGTATAGDGGTATAGYRGTATAGYRGTATAGYRGTATAGYRGTATAGDGGTATAGDGGTATAGDGGTATAGYRGTATAGYRGTATAGYRGTATAGDGGTATAGYRGTATAGDGGTATAGDGGTATAGYRGTATAGYRGTATAGDGGTATAGDGGTATAGDGGTATAGDGGTATAGDGGTATAGDGGNLCIRYWNGERYKLATFAVGEDGVEPNVPYGADEQGKLQAKSAGAR